MDKNQVDIFGGEIDQSVWVRSDEAAKILAVNGRTITRSAVSLRARIRGWEKRLSKSGSGRAWWYKRSDVVGYAETRRIGCPPKIRDVPHNEMRDE